MNGYLIAEITIAFLPILLFLVCLWLFDSFKLVDPQSLVWAMLTGTAVALAAITINSTLVQWTGFNFGTYAKFAAPFIEEALKMLFIIWVIQKNRVGFIVDSAIFGFAVGAGFAIIENSYYMTVLTDAGLSTWFVRGFGTAVMHGGTTAAAAIVSKDLADEKQWPGGFTYLPGFLVASVLHMLYNQFILPPITLTLVILVSLPPVIYVLFKISEQRLRDWLGDSLDTDVEMLQTVMAGNIGDTRIGRYMKTVQDSFPDYMMADIIGYLRIYLELSVKAKGFLIMKEHGIEPSVDPLTRAQFRELRFLEQSIGPMGKLALQPLLRTGRRDLWQLHALQKKEGAE